MSDAASTGPELRDEALVLLRRKNPDVVRVCTLEALRIVLGDGRVTADDVRNAVTIPDGVNPKVVGAVFRDLSDAGIIRRDGYVQSRRPKAHARTITVWVLGDAEKAATRYHALRGSPAPPPEDGAD